MCDPLHGSGPQGDNGMRLTVKGVETGTDCVKPFGSESFTGRGVGLEKTSREVRRGWTSAAFNQASGSSFEAGNHRDEGGSRDVRGESPELCGSHPDVNRARVGVSGNELSRPAMERLV